MREEFIQEHHASDHVRIDEYFKQYQENKTKDFVMAAKFFHRFRQALKRHIVWEEEILFPIFEDLNKSRGKELTKKMRQEHDEIEAALNSLAAEIDNKNLQTQKEEEKLIRAFKNHNEHEERDFYPALDNLVADKNQLENFARQNLSAID